MNDNLNKTDDSLISMHLLGRKQLVVENQTDSLAQLKQQSYVGEQRERC